MKQPMTRLEHVLDGPKRDSLWKTLAAATLGSLLFAGVAAASDVTSRTFNVRDYGAVGDDKADNTEAFSACLKAVIEAGGGRVFIPNGIYRGRILIPGTKAWICLGSA